MEGLLFVNEPTEKFLAFLKKRKIVHHTLNDLYGHTMYVKVPNYRLGTYTRIIGLWARFNGELL